MIKTVLKKAYSAIPLKKEIFSILKKVWRPNEIIYRHLHFHGVFNVKNCNGKKTIQLVKVKPVNWLILQ